MTDVFVQVAREHGNFLVACARRAAEDLGPEKLRIPFANCRAAILARLLAQAEGVPGEALDPTITGGWAEIANVIRSNRPLTMPEGHATAYHAHLEAAGSAAATALVGALPDRAVTLLDAGGGTGTYARAFVASAPGRRATLIDRADVLALGGEDAGVRRVAGDVRQIEGLAVGRHDVGLLSNVLHLHDPGVCAEIVAAVASMCDVVVVKDFRRDTLVGALFAMNMALYTEGGDVWSEADIGEWLSRAGCGDVSTLERPGVDEMVVLVGRPE